MNKKTLTSIIILFMGLFISVNSKVDAVGEIESSPTGIVKITEDIKNSENTNLSDLNSITTRLNYIEDEAGKKYFCLDADKWYPYGNYYSASEVLKNPVTAWLLKNYYQGKSVIGDQNEETQYAITQLAIWLITNPEKYNNAPVIMNNQIILDLIAEANTHVNDLSTTEILAKADLVLKPINQKFKLSEDGVNYVAQLKKEANEFLKMVDYQSEDFFVFTYNNQNITKHIKVDSDNFNKTISVNKDFFDSIYQKGVPLKIDLATSIKTSLFVGVAYYTENSNFQPLGSVENLVIEKEIQAYSEVFLDSGTIKIKKIEEGTKTALKNVEFSLMDKNKKILDKKVTNINGELEFTGLTFGTYYLQETKAINGYILDNKLHEITIDENTPESIYEITLTNKKEINQLGEIKLLKLEDGTNTPLHGVEFSLLDKDKKVQETKVTNENGELVFEDLPFGTYYLQETKALKGYILDNKLHEIKLDENTPELVHEMILTNKKEVNQLGKIKLIKLEEGTQTKLKGVEFTLYNQNKEKIDIRVTNDVGEIVFTDLPLGTYYLQETKALDNFIQDSVMHSIVIDNETPDFLVTLTLKNKRKVTSVASIEIIKQDKNTKKVLEGAEFTLINDKKEVVQTGVTNEEGKLIFSNLAFGKYYVEETKAPSGYVLEAKLFEIDLSEKVSNLNYVLTVDNEVITPTKEINKIVKKQLPKTGEEVFYQFYLTILGGIAVYYAMILKKK